MVSAHESEEKGDITGENWLKLTFLFGFCCCFDSHCAIQFDSRIIMAFTINSLLLVFCPALSLRQPQPFAVGKKRVSKSNTG